MCQARFDSVRAIMGLTPASAGSVRFHGLELVGMASHRIADRHYVMEKGRVVWQGESAALANDDSLKDRYLGV